MDIPSLAEQLIDVASITGEEAAIALEVEKVCLSLGFHCEREPVAENRWNLYVNWSGMPRVVYCTHFDTVPPFFPSRRSGEHIFGRGACDTRGIMAAMLGAGERLAKQGHAPSFLFVVGEETDSIGAKTAAASGRRAGYIIVGEPTDNLLARGHKGTLSYTLTTHGQAGHSAYPERSESAIHMLIDMLGEIRSSHWGSDDILGKATTNVGLISGGVAPNVTAPTASATIVHRIVDLVQARKQQALELCKGRAELVFFSENEPQFMHCPEGFDATTVSFGTDIPYLRNMGIPLLVGPGSIHDAHTADEKISIRQLHEAVDVYERLYHTLATDTP